MTDVETELADPEISRTAALLDGPRTLHCSIRNRLEAHDLLAEGLPGHALKYLVSKVAMFRAPQRGGMGKAVGISLRSYQRRMDELDKPLSLEQSGRTWKFAEILCRATALLGSQAGVQFVENHLGRLEYGVYT